MSSSDRMSSQFRIRLYTARSLSDVSICRALWELLSDPFLDVQKYDSVERARIPFDEHAFAKASELYKDSGTLFVRGGRDKFLASFSRESGGWSIWGFWLTIGSPVDARVEPWIEWLFKLCGKLPVLFGFACSEFEYDAKHTRVRQVPGGTATGAVGISIREFQLYLPGVYWLTILGREVVSGLNAEEAMSLSSVEAIQLDGNQLAIRLKEPVLPESIDGRLEMERRLADQLGAQFFFDRSRSDIKFQAIPELTQALSRLAR